MHPAPILFQLAHDRQHDRMAAAAEHRLVPSDPARTRVARTLRRTADRLDMGLPLEPGAKCTPRRRLLEPPPGPSARSPQSLGRFRGRVP